MRVSRLLHIRDPMPRHEGVCEYGINSAFPPSVRRSGTTYQRPNGQEASPKICLQHRHHQPQANYNIYLTNLTTPITTLTYLFSQYAPEGKQGQDDRNHETHAKKICADSHQKNIF